MIPNLQEMYLEGYSKFKIQMLQNFVNILETSIHVAEYLNLITMCFKSDNVASSQFELKSFRF